MTPLPDTHAFLGWPDDPQRLSDAARSAIGDGKNAASISAVVIREIAIKKAIGKLDAPTFWKG